MRLALAQALVFTAPNRWASQYTNTTDAKKAEITKKLAELDVSEATPADVARIIGNQSWSYLSCDECDQYVERAVEIEKYDQPVCICVSCARALAALASVVLP